MSTEELEVALSRPWSFRVEWTAHGDYLARVAEVDWCSGSAATADAAIDAARAALIDYLTYALEAGAPIPEPKRYNPRYSGRFQVRIPKWLHQALVDRAEREQCSLNQLVSTLLSTAIGGDREARHGDAARSRNVGR